MKNGLNYENSNWGESNAGVYMEAHN